MDEPESELDAVLKILDQMPGRQGDWMNVKYAAAIVAAMNGGPH